MNLYYVTNAVIPGKRVHAYQICKMCEAFADNGLKITLVLPRSSQILNKNLFEFYSCKNNFEVNYVNIFLDFLSLPKSIKFRLNLFIFSISIFFKFLFIKKQDTVIFSRDYLIAWLLKKIGFFVIYEGHNPILKKRYFSMLSKVDIIITNSDGTANEFIERGFENVYPFPNGVDADIFDTNMSKEEARKELRVDLNKKVVTYTGSLYKWKGVDLLIDVAKISRKNNNILFLILGGDEENIREYKDKTKKLKLGNIKFLGQKDRRVVAVYLKASDILVIPDLPLEKRSTQYTSPLKMFEYLISKRTVLVSDLPSMKKIVSKKEVIFFEAGNANDLFEKISANIDKKNISMIEDAYNLALSNSWKNRASRIKELI